MLEEGCVGDVPACRCGRVAGVGRVLPRLLGEPGGGAGPDVPVVIVAVGGGKGISLVLLVWVVFFSFP